MGTIVFKVSDNVKGKLDEFYDDYKRETTPPHSVFQAKIDDTVITLYNSGKVMFQGANSDIEARLWSEMEKNLNNNDIDITPSESKEKKKDSTTSSNGKYMYKTTIGSDEVGTGDVFGPIVVTSSYIKKEDVPYLKELGVADSKGITDEKILTIAPILMEKFNYYTAMFDNKTYNNKHSSTFNMNKMKAILHDEVLKKAVNENKEYDYIIMDQFVNSKKYYEYLPSDALKGITFLTKAENQVMSVAVGAIISRYIFLKEMDKISEKLGFEVLKGANNHVYNQIETVYKKFGKDMLYDVCKMNFKGIDEIMKNQTS